MRIAHFSDLHLLALDGARIFDYANKRWIGRLNLLATRSRHHHSNIFEAMVEDVNAAGVDHVVCTGDLTNLALIQEFRFAREMFERLSLAPDAITVIPGNHDSYVAEGLMHFRDIFEPYFQSDEEFATGEPGAPWPAVRVRGRVAIIGLSSSVPSPWFTAYGRIGSAQLDRLAEILADPRLGDKLRLVALHHPPNGKAGKNRVRGLRDYKRFQAIIEEHGAELVIHGHEHRDMRTDISGPDGTRVPVLGIQSGTYHANKPRRTARYRIFEFPDLASGKKDEPAHGRPRLPDHRLRLWDLAHAGFIDDPDDLSEDRAESAAPGATVA